MVTRRTPNSSSSLRVKRAFPTPCPARHVAEETVSGWRREGLTEVYRGNTNSLVRQSIARNHRSE
jgi:hypothetical protein